MVAEEGSTARRGSVQTHVVSVLKVWPHPGETRRVLAHGYDARKGDVVLLVLVMGDRLGWFTHAV